MESLEYLARRAEEELARSERAIKPAEYRAHLLLAHEYERRLIAANRGGAFAPEECARPPLM